jgi:predicted nucleic acid-binding protein
LKVLDTSVAVDHLRGVPSAVELLRRLVESGEQIAASELVRFELLAGVREEAREDLEELFKVPLWVPVDAQIARLGGDLARRFRKAHSGIDDADYLIAATTLVLDADLLTTNVRHFPMLRDLEPPY